MPPEIGKYEPVFTIGTVAQKLRVAVQTLRLYEQEGLVLPYKTPGGQRRYSLHDLERLLCIREMLTVYGLNLQGIRKLYALIPCWEYRGGLDADCRRCPVYHQVTGPCWSVPDVGAKCRQQNCRDCLVYRLPIHCHTLKPIIFQRWQSTYRENAPNGENLKR